LDCPDILVVDDENNVIKLITDALALEGWKTRAASDGEEALKFLTVNAPDVVLLDIRMPGLDGFETLRRIREASSVPVIMLSARSDEEDKVKCLKMGADDYITKPFGLKELIARIQVALRHHPGKSNQSASALYTWDDLRIDFGNLTIASGRQQTRLTRTEKALLWELVKNAGRTLDFDFLLSAVLGETYKGQRDYLYVYIRYLRLKLEPQPAKPRYLISIPGVGYKLNLPLNSSSQRSSTN
jgi:two-component system, OmpR family, KDP operon response regulator KdpE